MSQPTAPGRHAEPTPSPDSGVSGHVGPPAEERVRRRTALSPSRAADFRRCPLLYRFRAIDRLPERPSRAAVRGTLVHGVLERLFDLPAQQRLPAAARALLVPVWEELQAAEPELAAALFPAEPTGAGEHDGTTGVAEEVVGPEALTAAWLSSAAELLDAYFRLEDPRGVEPEARELLVESELESGVPLRGYIDRVDVAPGGRTTVVDYKTGAAPGPEREMSALFQLKFYALALLRGSGVLPSRLRLLYLSTSECLTYEPDEAELMRFSRLVDALWVAILEAGATGDFRPSPSRACDWCDHRAVCPAWGGTPPPYPGWPDRTGA